MNRIILASKSPRRRQLMDLLNVPYEVISADIDETINLQGDLKREIENLSYRKALAVYETNRDATVIGADTIVVVNNQVLGKPKNIDDAHAMLNMLQNNHHSVITGVTFLSSECKESFSVVSDVYFNPMTSYEIEKYIETGEPMDKAGAYGIQEEGAKFIHKIDGDYYAIMGFPISEIYTRIQKYL